MKKFLTCHWENLLYVNFPLDPKILTPFLPEDVEPALFEGKAMMSIVCFEFSRASFFGFQIPFHQFFPEVNVRVYVQNKKNPNLKGVYFISEMVPKAMTVWVAKYIFGEPFSVQKIRQKKSKNSLEYFCETENLQIQCSLKSSNEIIENFTDEERFVIEKEFAFCGKIGKKSKIFRVSHRPWKLLKTSNPSFSLQKINHIPEVLSNILCSSKPSSIFATDGSYVEVLR